MNSLHGLLNCEICGLYWHVITAQYRTRIPCIHMLHLLCNALIHVIYSGVSGQYYHTIYYIENRLLIWSYSIHISLSISLYTLFICTPFNAELLSPVNNGWTWKQMSRPVSFRTCLKENLYSLRVVACIKQEVNYLRAIFGYLSYIVHFPATLHVWNGLHVPYCTFFWTCWTVPCSTGLTMTMIHQPW